MHKETQPRRSFKAHQSGNLSSLNQLRVTRSSGQGRVLWGSSDMCTGLEAAGNGQRCDKGAASECAQGDVRFAV